MPAASGWDCAARSAGGGGGRPPAAGKALLAALRGGGGGGGSAPLDELDRRLAAVHSLPALTRKSIAQPGRLAKELAAIRKRGYSTDDEEALRGVCCVARAHRTSHREDGLLAISVSAIKDTLTARRKKLMHTTLDHLIELLQQRL
ncbi:MAG: hypothetical protein M5U07_05920 [Xanthobacteraceae bacterium]|nr:hypothetical protein [Xanthobacteraceae bacterium]